MAKYKKLLVKNVLDTRLDKFLKRFSNSFSHGFIQKLLRQKDIILNGKRTFSNQTLNDGDIIEYKDFINLEINNPNQNYLDNSLIKKFTHKELESRIIWDSEEFIAIDKSHYVAVQGGSNVKISLQNAISYWNQEKQGDLKIVHRLDKDTGGILIIAKGYVNAVKLTRAFKNRLIYKSYLALVDHFPQNIEGKIQDIHYYKDSCNNVKQRIAISFYKLLKKYKNHSLLLFQPITGIKHQIRKHALKIGCPIVGDRKYNSTQEYSALKLYATKVDIDYQIFKRKISIFSFPKEEFFQNFDIDRSYLYQFVEKFDYKDNSFYMPLN
ncbi:MAG: RluA family pseudouridine synthase [Rickettsia sp.]|nr:RluA family pseudouridine synthase [Rickettsia sp.]